MAETEFQELVGRIIEYGPSVGWKEDRNQQELVRIPDLDIITICQFHQSDTLSISLNEIDEGLAQSFSPDDRAHFRAKCFTAAKPNADGVCTWLVFETSHAISEGSDISKLLRRLSDDNFARKPKATARVRVGEIAALCMVPFLGPLHLVAAWAWKPRRSDFTFARISLNKGDVMQASRRLGIGKRALFFGLLTHALLPDHLGSKKSHVAYSTLPPERMKLDSENYLNVKIDEVKYQGSLDLETHLLGMQKELEQRKPSKTFVHIWQNKLQGLHRWLFKKVPFLYPKHFFDFAPYDLLLSLLPPIRPAKSWANLPDTTVFAGSNTGAYPACIIAIGDNDISLNFWLNRNKKRCLDTVLSDAAELGIEGRSWSSVG